MTEAIRSALELALHYPYVTEVALSPDGQWLVYGIREPRMTEDTSQFLVHLYRVPVAGGDPLRLTHGGYSNHRARFSPDSRTLAFLSTRSGRGNLYAIHLDGGEAWALTDHGDGDVQAFEWSPDGSAIAFVMADPPSEDTVAAQRAKDDAFRWGEQFSRSRLHRIAYEIAPRQMPHATPLTPADMHVVDFDWFPDSAAIAFTHRPSPLAGESLRTQLAIFSSSGPETPETPESLVQDIALVADWYGTVAVSPDGAWIACPTWIQPHRFAEGNRVVLYSPDGTDRRELAATPDELCVVHGWSPDGEGVYASEVAGIESQIWRVPSSGQPVQPVTTSATYKESIAVNSRGDIGFAARDFTTPHTIRRIDSQDGQCHDVITPALQPGEWLSGWSGALPDAPRVEVVCWPARAGKRELGRDTIEGLVIYPADYQPGQRYPLVVDIHGGPAAAFTRDYLPGEIQYGPAHAQSRRGFVVLRANPRGSLGYGRKFRLSVFGQWGSGDMPDILDGVDMLIETGLVDPERMAIIGASHGGFLTAYTIGQTDRFRAACAASPVTNLVSMAGTCDIPGYLADSLEHEHWQDPELYRANSPISHAAAISTPLLIQHTENDQRVPLGQAHELYYALKRCGVPTELMIYPRQGHGVAEPRLYIDMQRRVIEWIERWLGGESRR